MKVELKDNVCIVTTTIGDRKYRNSGWGSAESHLLHHVKQRLVRQGHDVIKRRMHADGHMMGDERTQYIRERGHKFYIYDEKWQLRDLAADFNEYGRVELTVQRNEQPRPIVRSNEPVP